MAKVFTFNHTRRGTYIDSISKVAGVNTNGRFEPTGKGIAWEGNGSNSYIDFSTINLGTVFTITGFFNSKTPTTEQAILGAIQMAHIGLQ